MTMNKYSVYIDTGTIVPYEVDDELLDGVKCFGQFLTAKTFAINTLEQKIESLVKLTVKEVKRQ